MSEILPTSGAPPTDLERLRTAQPKTLETEKARLRKTTKEFESFFLYYMLKTMRETLSSDPAIKDMPLGGSTGKDTYQQMFDMEVSRRMVQDGDRSLSAMLYRSMEKLVETQYNASRKKLTETPPTTVGRQPDPKDPIQLQREHSPVQLQKTGNQIPLRQVKVPAFAPLAHARRAAAVDPIRSQFGAIITQAAEVTKLDSALIHSVIKAESNGNPYAISRAGAKGLMQLADSTAADMGVANPFDPEANIIGGARYLRSLLDRYKGDLRLALAAYNAGPGTVEKHGGVPPFRETREYISRVTTYLNANASDSDDPLK